MSDRETSTNDKLRVFISHAAEDTQLTQILQKAIEDVCQPHTIDVFLDLDHLKFGREIPDVIEEALQKTDFFIGVATHNLRNQFSWCGLELGYYLSAGMGQKTIAYLYHKDIQDVFSPYRGTQIVSLSEKHKTTLGGKIGQVAESAIYQLLVQIGVEASRRNFPDDPIDHFVNLRTNAESGAIAITDAYAGQLVRNAKQTRYPQGRIVVTLRLDEGMPLAQGIETATVTIYPRAAYSLKIPGSSDESPAELDWSTFNNSGGVAGSTHLSVIIYEIIGAFLPDQFDAKNDYLFQTPDNHTYRVILVRYEKFGDGRSEFIFNLIETLVPLQGGDPRTTLITSAIVMATQFRSLFIESDAIYSPNKLAAIDGLSDTAKDLLRDLRRVRIESATLQITETNLAEALGEGEKVHNWNTQWWPPVQVLEKAAQEFIEDTSATNRTKFLDALKKMIETTCEINRQFTSLCLKVYKEIIDKN